MPDLKVAESESFRRCYRSNFIGRRETIGRNVAKACRLSNLHSAVIRSYWQHVLRGFDHCTLAE
jgi:hypothetical protein